MKPRPNQTSISISTTAKEHLDQLKEAYSDISFSDLIEYLLVQSQHMEPEDCRSNYYATFKKINNQG